MARQTALKKDSSRRERSVRPKLQTIIENDADNAPQDRFERLIHERSRLGIVSALAVNETLSFNDLKKLIRTTDGNLSVHARKLEDAGYLACKKTFEGRTPRTEYSLTRAGRNALEQYLNHMEALILTMRNR